MNILPATLTAITSSEHLSILTVCVGDDHFHLLLAEQCHNPIGTPLLLAFKETEVILVKSSVGTTANIFQGSIRTIEKGSILSQVILNYQEMTITSLVSTLALERLEIKENDTLSWMVQPSEISLLRSHHGS